MIPRVPLLMAPILLAACAHGAVPSEDRERTLRVGQTGDFGQIRVTPVQVVEDSRCPANVQCIQAGTVRVRALVEPPAGGAERILKIGEAHLISGGSLVLAQADPQRTTTSPIGQPEYRLVLRYTYPRRH